MVWRTCILCDVKMHKIFENYFIKSCINVQAVGFFPIKTFQIFFRPCYKWYNHDELHVSINALLYSSWDERLSLKSCMQWFSVHKTITETRKRKTTNSFEERGDMHYLKNNYENICESSNFYFLTSSFTLQWRSQR